MRRIGNCQQSLSTHCEHSSLAGRASAKRWSADLADEPLCGGTRPGTVVDDRLLVGISPCTKSVSNRTVHCFSPTDQSALRWEKWSLLVGSSTRWILPHGELPEFRVPVPSMRQFALPRLRGAAQTREAALIGSMIGQDAGQPDDGFAPRLHVRAAACGRCERRSWTCPPRGWSSCCRRR
jgi:hypothetical protein